MIFLRALFQMMSRRQPKSFSVQQFFKNAAEVWASSPHLRSKLYLQQVFPAAIAFLETYQFAILWFIRNKLQIRTRQRGNCSTLAGKSRGGTPFCRTLKTVFPKRSSSRNTTRIRFGKAGAHPQLALGIAIAPETLSLIATFHFWRQLQFFQFALRFLLLLITHSLQGTAVPQCH